MRRILVAAFAAGLVVSPLLTAAYWRLYPAYGDLHSADILADLSASPDRTQVADVMALGAIFLVVPGALAYLRALSSHSPRLARTGTGLVVIGWMAILPLVTLDLVAVELAGDPALFGRIYGNPVVVTLSGLATLHIVGGVLVGVALIRSRLIARPLAVAAALAPVVHLGSNLAGLLWLDLVTWLVLAATGVALLPNLARLVAADEPVLGREEGRRSTRADADLGVDVLDVT